MKIMRSVGISFVMILLSAPLVRGQDLSKYRGFSLGMSLPELSSQVALRPLQTKLIQKHPAVIQELTFWPGAGSSEYSRQTVTDSHVNAADLIHLGYRFGTIKSAKFG
jgi:hypothetical protein